MTSNHVDADTETMALNHVDANAETMASNHVDVNAETIASNHVDANAEAMTSNHVDANAVVEENNDREQIESTNVCVDAQTTNETITNHQPLIRTNNHEIGIETISLSIQQHDQALGDRFREFGSRTTAHGIPRILSAKSCCAKIMWSMSFIFCLVVFGAAVWFVTEKFSRHETITNIQVLFAVIIIF